MDNPTSNLSRDDILKKLKEFKTYVHFDFDSNHEQLYFEQENTDLINQLYLNVKNKQELLEKYIEIINEIKSDVEKYSRLIFDTSFSNNYELFKFICQQNPIYFKEAEINFYQDRAEETTRYILLSKIMYHFSECHHMFTSYFYYKLPIYYEHPQRLNEFYEVLFKHLRNNNIEKVSMLVDIFKKKHPNEIEFTFNFYNTNTKINIFNQVIIDSDIKSIECIYSNFREIIVSNIEKNDDYINNLVHFVYKNSYYFVSVEDPIFDIDMKIIYLLDTFPLKLLNIKSLVSLFIQMNNVRVSNYLLTTFTIDFCPKKLLKNLLKKMMKLFNKHISEKNTYQQFYVNYPGDFKNITEYIFERNPKDYTNEKIYLRCYMLLLTITFQIILWNFVQNIEIKIHHLVYLITIRYFGIFVNQETKIKQKKH